jgi:hypothetical protein
MRFVIRKRLSSFEPSVPDANLKFVTDCDLATLPRPGTWIQTGALKNLIISSGFDHRIGCWATIDDYPSLNRALEEVKKKQSFEDVLNEYLAAGWKIDDGSELNPDSDVRRSPDRAL